MINLMYIDNNILSIKNDNYEYTYIFNAEDFNNNDIIINYKDKSLNIMKIDDYSIMIDTIINPTIDYIITNNKKYLLHIIDNKITKFDNIYDFNFCNDVLLVNKLNKLLPLKQKLILNYIDNIYIFFEHITEYVSLIKEKINSYYNNTYVNLFYQLEKQSFQYISIKNENKQSYLCYNLNNCRPYTTEISHFKSIIPDNINKYYSLDYKYSMLQLFKIYLNIENGTSIEKIIDEEDYKNNKIKYLTLLFNTQNEISNSYYKKQNFLINKILDLRMETFKKLIKIDNNKYIMKSPIFEKEYIVTNKNYFAIFYQLLETEFNILVLDNNPDFLSKIILYKYDEFILKNIDKKTIKNNLIFNNINYNIIELK